MIARAIGLPVKQPFQPYIRDVLQQHLQLPGCVMDLWPLQAEALYEAMMADGLIALMGVGSGKTLTSALLPTVLKAERPLVLTRAALTSQQRKSYRELSESWNLHPDIQVWSYHDLSQSGALARIRALNPDLIVADEAHRIARDSARTNRLIDYFLEKDEQGDPPRLCALSGTLFRRKIEDMWRPFFLALGDSSPVPFEPNTRHLLSVVIDTTHQSRKSRKAMEIAYSTMEPLQDWADETDVPTPTALIQPRNKQERLREALRKRCYATQGVMGSAGQVLPHGLEIYRWEPEYPPAVKQAMEQFGDLWQRPDGQFIDEAMEAVAFKRQLSAGFFYRFDWPNGEIDHEWLEARAEWHAWVRRQIKHHRAEGYDTPALVRAEAELSPPPELIRWKKVEHRPPPPSVPEWVSLGIVDQAWEWLKEQDEPTIIWTHHTAVLEAFSLWEWDLTVFGPNDTLDETTREKYVVATAHAHGEGKNLQYYSNQLVLHPPPAGADWEQLIGRTDRPGQQADTVKVHVAAYNEQYESDIADARRDAEAIEMLTGIRQRLNKATWVDW